MRKKLCGWEAKKIVEGGERIKILKGGTAILLLGNARKISPRVTEKAASG